MREHALAHKRPTQSNTVEPAYQSAGMPGLHAMGQSDMMQIGICLNELIVDPGLLALSAAPHYGLKGCIHAYLIDSFADCGPQRAGDAEMLVLQNRARI